MLSCCRDAVSYDGVGRSPQILPGLDHEHSHGASRAGGWPCHRPLAGVKLAQGSSGSLGLLVPQTDTCGAEHAGTDGRRHKNLAGQ